MMIANTLPNSDRMAQIRIAIRELEAQEQLVLMEELANLLRRRIQRAQPKRAVTEFRGVGKQAWRGVDVAEYIRRERESWDS